jgi:SHS2 domain-containing protein
VEPEEYVVICHEGKEVELELEDDQSLLFSTLKSQWLTATGLFYRPNEDINNRSRGIKMTGEKFLPPKHGWGNRIYHVVTSDTTTTGK